MGPREKAKELVDRYDYTLTYVESKAKAKQCALIAVDEIIKAIDWHEFESPSNELVFWSIVKKEIIKL